MSYRRLMSDSETLPITRKPMAGRKRRKITLLIFGKTGSGISSTGNTILSKNAFPVRTSMVPSRDTSYSYAETSKDGEEIMVISVTDLLTLTPESREQYVTDLKRRLERENISAILMVIRANNRFTDDQYNLYLMMKDLLGEEVIESELIVVFTASSGFSHSTLKDASDTLQKIISDANQRYVFIDNKVSNYRKGMQVCRLLTTVDRLTDPRAQERTLRCWQKVILRMTDLWCVLQQIHPRYYVLLLCVLLVSGIILFLSIYFSKYDIGHSLNEWETNVTKSILWVANTTKQISNYVK